MDILRFVDSNAIAQHWKKIGYEPTPLEAAWLIWNCSTATRDEKHRAWQEIIDTMPDMPIEWENWGAPRESLHRFLAAYMDMEDGWLEEVKNPRGPVRYRGDDGTYRTLQDLITRDSCVNDGSAVLEYLWKDRLLVFEVRDGTVKRANLHHSAAEEDYVLLEASFPTLWFAFPVPFQKGDIVRQTRQYICEACSYDGEPFVLEETCVEVSRRLGHPLTDMTDMTAYGYFQDWWGGLYHECMQSYLSLDYVPPEELTGKRRVLTTLSSVLKGEIDVSLFARAYHQILLEEHARDVRPKDITPEGLRLAGLEERR